MGPLLITQLIGSLRDALGRVLPASSTLLSQLLGSVLHVAGLLWALARFRGLPRSPGSLILIVTSNIVLVWLPGRLGGWGRRSV